MVNVVPVSVLTKKQYKDFGPRPTGGYADGAMITTRARYDDACGNGHNTFGITAEVRESGRGFAAGGCLHKEIAKVFPELAHLVKWHLCSSDGPMYYIANTCYAAGARDYWGKLKGEPMHFETFISFGKNPIKHKFGTRFTRFLEEAKAHPGAGPFDFEVLAVAHIGPGVAGHKFKPKYTFGGFDAEWHQCPFDDEARALDFLTALQTCGPIFTELPTAWGEGKARELDSARVAAIWPDATDADLTAPDLKSRLEARLPQLLADFHAAMTSPPLNFVW